MTAQAPRIAFCIYGQLRDEHLSFPETARIARALGASVFISTWRRRGAKTSGATNPSQFIRMFGHEAGYALPRQLGYRFHETFPLFAERVTAGAGTVVAEDLLGYFPEAVVDIEDEVLDLEFTRTVADNNSLRMLYKQWRCNELKRARERRDGRPFDVVVLFRPDVVPPEPVSIPGAEAVRDAVFLPEGGWAPRHAHDVISIASSATADAIAGLFAKAAEEREGRAWAGIHPELHAQISAIGKEVRFIPMNLRLIEDAPRRQPLNRAALRALLAEGAWNCRGWPAPQEAMGHYLVQILDAIEDTIAGQPHRAIERLVELILSNPPLVVLESACSAGAEAMLKLGRSREAYLLFLLRVLAALVPQPTWLEDGEFRRNLERMVDAADDLTGEQADTTALEALIEAEAEPEGLVRDAWYALLHFAPHTRLDVELAKLARHFGSDMVLQSRRFWTALRASRIERAGGIARAMQEHAPEDWRGPDHLGHYYAARNEFGPALENARAALAMAPNNWGLRARVGSLLDADGAREEALGFYRDALALHRDFHVQEKYVRLLLALNRGEDARRAVAELPQDGSPAGELRRRLEALLPEPAA